MNHVFAVLALALAASVTGCAQAPWSKQVATPARPAAQATVATPQPAPQIAQATAVAPVVVAAPVSAASTPISSAYPEWKWQKFGADPYAKTRADAMQTRESAFKKLGLPAPVIAQFMRATEKPGEKIRLTVGDRLTAMLSKGGVIHHNVVVAFGSPIRGMEYAAPTEKWQVSHEGKTYTVILPDVCFNWSDIVASVPQPQPAVARPATSQGVACPNGRFFLLRAFSRASMGDTPLGREADRLMTISNKRDGKDGEDPDVFVGDALSTTLGPWLNRELTPAKVELDAIIQFWRRELSTGKIVRREAGFAKMRDGMGEFRFNEDPTKYVATSATFRKDEVLSPAVSGGRRQLVEQKWKSCGIRLNVVVP